ncbi:MAG: alpha/beta hydrolase [Thermomicrobia bacterium]|nr:alpha/beta hydrolase [Thermomicrobia bacterium]MCA1723236.1 alpha/beta hydrolase [Thermomicrobia bacterium]
MGDPGIGTVVPVGVTLPRFEPAPCPFRLAIGQVEGQNVACGEVIVPERHANPYGATIRLAVARFKGQFAAPGAAATIYLTGGPGDSILSAPNAAWFAFQQQETSDIILFDQRGTGQSIPSLDCPEVKDQIRLDYTFPLSQTEDDSHALTASLACRDRLIKQGIDLSAYTSEESAADVNDIRAVFGYATINLLGVSYGTRLALTIMRDFPDTVRSAVLDSVVPPQIAVLSESATNFAHALDGDFAACVGQGACHVDAATLDADLGIVVGRLNANPVTLHVLEPQSGTTRTLVITGDRLMTLIYGWLFSPYYGGNVPAMIEELKGGTTTMLMNAVTPTFFYRPVFVLDLGMFYSVSCGELVADAQRGAPPVQTGIPASIRETIGVSGIYPPATFATCAQWPVQRGRPTDRQPVTSAIPTLILASANDPVTPPAYGQVVARTLAHGVYLEVPGNGHGVMGYPCGMTMTHAFLTAPTRTVDTACTNTFGITYTGTR